MIVYVPDGARSSPCTWGLTASGRIKSLNHTEFPMHVGINRPQSEGNKKGV